MAELLTELDTAIAAAEQFAKSEQERSLDPLQMPDPHAARQAADDALFSANRLRTLQGRLLPRFRQVVQDEKVRDYEKSLPPNSARSLHCLRRILGVFARMKDFDREAHVVNLSRPAGCPEFMTGVEAYTRGIQKFDRENPSIVDHTQLQRGDGLTVWPPRQTIDPLIYSGGFMHIAHPGKDWALLQQQRAEQQREQQQKQEAEAEQDAIARQEQSGAPVWWVNGRRIEGG